MTILEARRICEDFYKLSNPDDEDLFLAAEALDYLIEETKDPGYMLDLGAIYYGEGQFELALKYYEMAAAYDETNAMIGLGYIWYYGRTGTRDYKKAFQYFDRARRRGDQNAAYKVADMYRRGLYVKKDPAKYRRIIEDLYREITRNRKWYIQNPYSKLPEVYLRMGEILAEDGQTKKALKLFETARTVLARRIQDSCFFGDRTIMKELIVRIYELRGRNPGETDSRNPGETGGRNPGETGGRADSNIGDDFELYDLYELLKSPCLIRFIFEGEEHEAEALEEDGVLVIRFDDKWYRTVDDFFAEAQIGTEKLTSLYEELYGFEKVKK